MANSRVIDAGAVTAYGAAVAGGYQGTYEQWCAGMADFGKNVTEVSEKAEQVAENAAAVEEARQEVEEDKEIVDGAIAGIQAAKADALAGIETKKDEALQAIEEAGSTQTWNVNNAGETQLAAVNAAGVVMTTSVNNAGAAQVEAIRAEGNMQYGRATEEANRAEEQAELAGNSATAASEAAQTATSMAEDASASEENASASAAAAAASAEAAANASALEVKTITDVPIASFSDGADSIPIKGMTVNVDPVQDLHGYDNPWPAGGNSNKMDEDFELGGIINASGEPYSASDRIRTKNFSKCEANTSYYAYNGVNNGSIYWYAEDYSYISYAAAVNQVITSPNNAAYFKYVIGGVTEYGNNVAINYPSSVTTYSPYENNCPITGWDESSVIVNGKNKLPFSPVYFASPLTDVFDNQRCFPLKQGTYRFSFDSFVGATNWRFGFTLFDLKKERYYDSSLTFGSFSANDSGRYYVTATNTSLTAFNLNMRIDGYIHLFFVLGDTSVSSYVVNPQIEEGSSTTDYEPYNGHIYEINFPAAAGTVYGAKLINEGTETWKLRVNYKSIDLATLNWSKTSVFYATVSDIQPLSNGWCSIFPVANANQPAPSGINILIRGDATIYVRNIAGTIYENMTPQEFAAAMNGVQFVYCIATTVEYTITGEVVETLLGVNNIWADTGNIAELKYRAMFNTNLIKALIAPVLPSMVADTALAVNDFRIVGDTLYIVTAPIASGGTLTVGTNCRATTVGEQITALLNA